MFAHSFCLSSANVSSLVIQVNASHFFNLYQSLNKFSRRQLDIIFLFFFFPERRQFAWNVKSYFLEKVFQNAVCWNFLSNMQSTKQINSEFAKERHIRDKSTIKDHVTNKPWNNNTPPLSCCRQITLEQTQSRSPQYQCTHQIWWKSTEIYCPESKIQMCCGQITLSK